MNFSLIFSLEQLALIKTVITLWHPDDIIRAEFYFGGVKRVAESHVMEKVKKLPLPESLKKKVLCFIRPIGLEIHNCMHDYREILFDATEVEFRSLVTKNLKMLCWTSQGTVDRRKAAEVIIRDVNIKMDIAKRYKLACINCLKNDIVMLWNNMPEDCRKSFYSEEDQRYVNQDRLVVLWTYDIKGELARMHRMFEVRWPGCTPYQYAFDYALSRDNKPATEHFFKKLTSEERKECLKRRNMYFPRTLCYLLSQMNEVEQEVICEEHYHVVLEGLLEWPLQGLFMEMAKHLWLPGLSLSKYYSLFPILMDIICKVRDGFKDYNYQKLFTEFWQVIPITDKKDVIFNNGFTSLLRNLLLLKDYQNIQLILRDATTLDREKFIFSDKGKDVCEELMNADEMDLLEFFVQESISSKDLMVKFREEFEKYLWCHSKGKLQKERDLWNKVFQLLSDISQNFDKRKCVEEGNDGPVKRLCSLTSE